MHNLYRYVAVNSRKVMASVLAAMGITDEKFAPVGLGLRVALKDAHWSALCREPMTRDVVSFRRGLRCVSL
jgi:hypothetical protein